MANYNITANKTHTYDAIVVGSGISGGWAAKELTEKGLNTLVLERGRIVEHVKDYPTANLDPWDFELRGGLTAEEQARHYKNGRAGFIGKDTEHFWANDLETPYTEAQPFFWVRAHQMGGRSLLWGKQTYRWSDIDFRANAEDGHGVDWPIRYRDIEPWYSYVEKFAGISGSKEGLKQLPDSEFLPPMEMNVVEKHVRDRIEKHFPGRRMIIGRCAHLTVPHNGRGQCQYRNRCGRGCPYGAYFSSNSATLPAANKTGKLTIRPWSIAQSVIYDDKQGKATGVRIIDAETNETIDYRARIIFLNAGSLASTQIMMRSTSNRFENGLGNDSGELGHNLMDHTYFAGAMGRIEGFDDRYYKGRRPNGIYIPRYQNIDAASKSDDFVRGFGFQGGAGRRGARDQANKAEYGAGYKDQLFTPGPWEFFITGFAEALPVHENHIRLNPDVLDKWGQPTLTIDATWDDNALRMRKQCTTDATEMLERAGAKDIRSFDANREMGYGIHEMGTARMGRDPKTSVLNKWNQVWGAENVFVTDGACMTSAACVNPSLTYMALTARAADHAVAELNRGNL